MTNLTNEDIKQRIHPGNEIEVDEGTRESPEGQIEDENDAIEDLKQIKENENGLGDNTSLVEKAKHYEMLESDSGYKIC